MLFDVSEQAMKIVLESGPLIDVKKEKFASFKTKFGTSYHPLLQYSSRNKNGIYFDKKCHFKCFPHTKVKKHSRHIIIKLRA